MALENAFKSVFNLLRNAQNINVYKIAITITNKGEIKKFIVDLNTLGQLYEKGIDSWGENIQPEGYSIYTIEGTSKYKGKKAKNQRYDHVTLNDTGEFYKSFEVNIYDDYSFTIKANDDKQGTELTKIYGNEIVGLGTENESKLMDKIFPLIMIEIKNQLFK